MFRSLMRASFANTLSLTPPEYEDNSIKLYELNLGLFLGVLFEIRTFLVARNHMILSYKMVFSSIFADPPSKRQNPSDS